jgi:pSer/pThr/pTyr-binding forkhead associated (FHA) protein
VKLCNAYLIIAKGAPHPFNTEKILGYKDIILGRPWQNNNPDIAFISPLISRKHAIIRFENNHFVIMDMASKHGTTVNDNFLEPNVPVPLGHDDCIRLAQGEAILTFKNLLQTEVDTTVDLEHYISSLPGSPERPIMIKLERREVIIDGSPLNLSGKDLDLLLYLYINRNKAVSYNQIRSMVWPERPHSEDNIPDVGNDEISALVYRLRKRLGKYSSLIVTIPRYGYRFDLE